MPAERTTDRWRGRAACTLCFAVWLVAIGCATTEPRGAPTLRPGLQHVPTNQVVGEAIVSSLGGASVTLRWLNAGAVDSYYASRQGLVNPWPKELWKEAPPTIFFLRINNQTREEVQFDPSLVALIAQDGGRQRPIPYEEMYMRLQEGKKQDEDPAPRLLSLQASLLSRFVVISPGGQREGLLLFPTIHPEAKLLLLEFASFFVGGRMVPSRFEFQVVRQADR